MKRISLFNHFPLKIVVKLKDRLPPPLSWIVIIYEASNPMVRLGKEKCLFTLKNNTIPVFKAYHNKYDQIMKGGLAMPELFPSLSGGQRLSLCMIVRDEAVNLQRCLHSSAGWVDEIIVVDTGSQDQSREIAREFGAKVIDFEWRDDFAAGRNFSLAQASGDWVIFLDADEELTPESGAILRHTIADSQMEGFLCHLLCFSNPDDQRTANTIQVLRLFRRRPDYRFTGRIHEQIIDTILKQYSSATIGIAPIIIKHYGYFPQERQRQQKAERNLKLLRKELEESGPTPDILYYLGSEYYASHENAQALDYFLQAEAGNRTAPFSQLSLLILRNILLSLYSLQRHSEIIERIAQALPQYPEYTDLFYFRANSWLQLNKPLNAYRDLVSCLKLGEARYPYPSTTGFGSFLAWQQLGDLLLTQGRRKHAKLAYQNSLAANPWQASAWRQLHRLCLTGADPYLEWQHLQFFFIGFMQLEINARLTVAECLTGLADWRWIRAFLQAGADEVISPANSGRYYFLQGCAHFFEREREAAFDCFGRIPANEAAIYSRQINLLTRLAALISKHESSLVFPVDPKHEPEELFFRQLQQFFAEGRELADHFFTGPLARMTLETVKYLSFLRENRLLARLSAAIVKQASFSAKHETLAFLISRNHLTLAAELLRDYRGSLPNGHQELSSCLRLEALLSLKDRNAADRLICLRQALDAGLKDPRFAAALAEASEIRTRRRPSTLPGTSMSNCPIR
jgi:glycosyltransferase involved in cell wall biosynthesis